MFIKSTLKTFLPRTVFFLGSKPDLTKRFFSSFQGASSPSLKEKKIIPLLFLATGCTGWFLNHEASKKTADQKFLQEIHLWSQTLDPIKTVVKIHHSEVSDNTKNEAYRLIIPIALKNGEFTPAIYAANELLDPEEKDCFLKDIAHYAIQKNNLYYAVDAIKELKNRNKRDELLIKIALKAKENDPESNFIKYVLMIEDTKTRMQTFNELNQNKTTKLNHQDLKVCQLFFSFSIANENHSHKNRKNQMNKVPPVLDLATFNREKPDEIQEVVEPTFPHESHPASSKNSINKEQTQDQAL